MFKLFTFAALLAVAVATPGLVQTHVVAQPVVAKVGAIVHSAPSAYSHQSISQVHSNTHVVKTFAAPVLHTYAAAPIVPVVKTFAPVVPVVKTVVPVAPIVKTVVPVAPVVKTYSHYIH